MKKQAELTLCIVANLLRLVCFLLVFVLFSINGGREPDSATEAWREIGNSQALTDVYNGEALHSFYSKLFGSAHNNQHTDNHTTFPSCTWLRAKGANEVTAEHADYYYFRENTEMFKSSWDGEKQEDNDNCSACNTLTTQGDRVTCTLCNVTTHYFCTSPALRSNRVKGEYHCNSCADTAYPYWTCWVSLGSADRETGRLCVVPGSHSALTGYNRPSRSGLLPGGYSKSFAAKSIWRTTEFGPGDIVLFNMKLVHAATEHRSQTFRISLDTRVTTCCGDEWRRVHPNTTFKPIIATSAAVPVVNAKRSTVVKEEDSTSSKQQDVNTATQPRAKRQKLES